MRCISLEIVCIDYPNEAPLCLLPTPHHAQSSLLHLIDICNRRCMFWRYRDGNVHKECIPCGLEQPPSVWDPTGLLTETPLRKKRPGRWRNGSFPADQKPPTQKLVMAARAEKVRLIMSNFTRAQNSIELALLP